MEGLSAKIPDHSIGGLIVYRNNGIYRIGDIRKESFCGIGERTYYFMCSVYDKNSVIYVPIDSKDISSTMRPILSPEDIDGAISRAVSSENTWRDDVKERAEYFDRLFDSGDTSDILWIHKSLSRYKAGLEAGRRKLYASDSRILAAAEKIIIEEFSYTLGIEKSAVLPYIVEKAKKIRAQTGE